MITDENRIKLEMACGTVKCGCALDRLAKFMDFTGLDLGSVGERVGLTGYECEGIMDGWDVGTNVYGPTSMGLYHWAYYPIGEQVASAWGIGHETEYEAGRALGMRLAHQFASAT